MALDQATRKRAESFVQEKGIVGTDRMAFLNNLSEDMIKFVIDNYPSINGKISSFLSEIGIYAEKDAVKKQEVFEKFKTSIIGSAAIPKASEPASVVQVATPSTQVVKPKDTTTDLNTRRLLINFAAIVFEVPTESNTLPGVLAKVIERHQAFCNKASSFLEHIAPGSTAIKAAVEGHGTVQLFANFFGIQSPVDSINESSELGALTTVWVNTYKKEWAGTNAEMSDADRILRFEEKKKRIIEKTADEIAAFAGYESKEDLIKELIDIFKNAIEIIKEHVMSR